MDDYEGINNDWFVKKQFPKEFSVFSFPYDWSYLANGGHCRWDQDPIL